MAHFLRMRREAEIAHDQGETQQIGVDRPAIVCDIRHAEATIIKSGLLSPITPGRS
jgi:hypothetical protein